MAGAFGQGQKSTIGEASGLLVALCADRQDQGQRDTVYRVSLILGGGDLNTLDPGVPRHDNHTATDQRGNYLMKKTRCLRRGAMEQWSNSPPEKRRPPRDAAERLMKKDPTHCIGMTLEDGSGLELESLDEFQLVVPRSFLSLPSSKCSFRISARKVS